ncbi:MAG: M4 family metallopeptidase, partial [Planctomycetota bacterium]|nr:M4 family metallopeptidase [Planctomycetota bacterium]
GDLYRLLFDGLGRDSLDGNGGTLTSTVHWNDGICPNAIWNGNQSAFCNGLATDDVVAHEFTHGLTQFTADLIYQNQPGQLNEAYSDIFGETIDLWNGDASEVGTPGGIPWPGGSTGGGLDTPNSARTGCSDGSARWRMGEETSLDAIRDMWFPECFNDPPSTTDPLYNQNACGPSDNGGVHTGSGVFNHSYAMLVDGKDFNGQTISAIGLTKTAAVYFRTLTVYMTAATDFPEAETLMNQAAADLVNSSPNDPRTGLPGDVFTQDDADQVAASMIAVGMSEAVCGQVPPGPPPSNDDCAGSIALFVGLNDIDSNNATSGGPPGDSSQCAGTFLGDVGNDIWYSYVPPEDGLLTVSTCDIANWDTDLLVYSGNCGGGLTQLACNGDTGGCSTFTSLIENVPVTGGETYRVRVASWSEGTTGTGQLDVSFVGGGGGGVENCSNGVDDDGDGLIDCEDPECATAPNCIVQASGDECARAIAATIGSTPVDTTTATQSSDPFDDSNCPGTFLGEMINDVWYEFTAPTSGDYTVSTCDLIDFDSDIVVYTGSCSALTQVACNGDGSGCGGFSSFVEISMNGGDIYYVRIGGFNGAAIGTGFVEIEAAAPGPLPEQCNNGTDDDNDGLVDCEDPDCVGDPDCICEPATSLVCSQGSSNDVLLSWANGEAYLEITVRRDGIVVATIPGTFTSHTDFSAPIGNHTYAVTGSCGANQQAPQTNCDIEVVQTAGFTMRALDVSTGYNTAGALFETDLVCQELTSNSGFPTSTAGFSFGLGHDASLLEATSAEPTGPIADLDGGNGPSFFDSTSYPDGVAAGCVYTFTFAETIQMIDETALVRISYQTLPGALAGATGTVTTTLQLVENLGIPPVQNIVSTDTGVGVGVLGEVGTVTLEPTGFILTAPDQVVTFPESTGAASFDAFFSLAEDPANAGYPNDTQGFSLGVSHDPSILTGTGGAGAQVIADLNGGSGPDFIDVNLFSDGFTVGCVYSFQGIETIQFATATDLVTASYDTVPGALAGSTVDVTTTLTISDALGNPPVEVIVVVGSGSVNVTGIEGTITLTPVIGGFLRADINDDAAINLADAIALLNILFLGGVIFCSDASDTNDDELANIADAIYLLAYLFTGGDAPPPPFGGVCGPDPSGTVLDCAEYNSCP